MVNIALIEDDRYMQEIIRACMEKEIRASEKVKIEIFDEAEDFQKVLMKGEQYQIVFSDIELGGMNGITLAKVLQEKWPETYVIFVTAYSEYAVESYRLDAYQYILKEEMEERLPIILRTVLNKIERERKRFCILKREDEREKVFYKDIIYIIKSKAAKYVRYITTNGEFRERSTLQMVIKELNVDDFLKADRGCIVNIKHIYKIKGNIIFMDNGAQIPVSRGNLAKVKKEINLRWSRE